MPVAVADVAPRQALTWRDLARPGVHVIRDLWKPFVAIQFCGLLIVVAFFTLESVKASMLHVAEWKRQGGYAFSAVTMAFAGGVVPEVFKFLTGVDRSFHVERLRHMLFNMCLFACTGMIVDGYYRLITLLLGDSNAIRIVLTKVLIDQFAFTPLLGSVMIPLAYTWRSTRYCLRTTARQLGRRWYLTRVVPVLLPCWAYWIPMTCLMYSLPASLQFAFGAVGSAASATIMTAAAIRAMGAAR